MNENSLPKEKKYQTLKEFYPFYLSQHRNDINQKLHLIGTTLVTMIIILSLLYGKYGALLLLPFVGYGFAWVGHFFFEQNKPATFKYPGFSLVCDFIMCAELYLQLFGFINKLNTIY